MPTPNWLTAWVKINAKHGMHPGSPEKPSDFDRLHKSSTSKASTAQLSEDSSSSSFSKRPVTKRNRSRGLQRTFSASDLIREAATGGSGSFSKRDVGDVVTDGKGLKDSLNDSRRPNDHDGDTQSTAKSSVDQLLPDSSHGSQFLDEIMFIQKPQPKQTQTQNNKGSTDNSKIHDQSIVSLLSLPPFPKLSQPPSPPQPVPKMGLAGLLPHPFFANQQVCQQCNSLTSQLDAMRDDLEYLRRLALQQESDDRASVRVKKLPAPLAQQQRAAPSLASLQLTDVVTRQRKQIEQLMKERSRWQQDMHFKLTKFANLCKDLNEESAVRNSEAVSLKQELRCVKEERDSMAEELAILRAQARLYEKQQEDVERMKERFATFETNALAQQSEAVQSRDKVIADLTSKLERVLSELEATRQQSTQRRVIFPDTTRR